MMLSDKAIFIIVTLFILVFSHVVLYFSFKYIAGFFYKPRTEKGKIALLRFSKSLKWGLFFVIFPIFEPYFSPDDLVYIKDQPIFTVLFIINLTWIIIELSNVLRHSFLERYAYDKADNLKERRIRLHRDPQLRQQLGASALRGNGAVSVLQNRNSAGGQNEHHRGRAGPRVRRRGAATAPQ
jgi:hypothetical protein